MFIVRNIGPGSPIREESTKILLMTISLRLGGVNEKNICLHLVLQFCPFLLACLSQGTRTVQFTGFRSSGKFRWAAMAVANVVPTVSTNVVDDVPKTRPGGYEEVRETRKTNVVLPNNVAVANDTWSIRCQRMCFMFFFCGGGVGKRHISQTNQTGQTFENKLCVYCWTWREIQSRFRSFNWTMALVKLCRHFLLEMSRGKSPAENEHFVLKIDHPKRSQEEILIPSMYGVFTYTCFIFMVTLLGQ